MEYDRSRGRSLPRPIEFTQGKVYRNPFLNFLKDFRKSHKNKLDAVEVTKRAAQLWRIMNEREKSPYINMAKQAPKRKRSTSYKKLAKKPRMTKGKDKKVNKTRQRKEKVIHHTCKHNKSCINKTAKKKSKKVLSNKDQMNVKAKKSTGLKVKAKKCICGRVITF